MSTATQTWPDARGRFGPYGGRYVPETLVAPLEELEHAYGEARKDPSFQSELDYLLKNFAGRPTPLQFASRLTEHLGGPRIYIKREDLLHTGAHKINNCIGQGLLAVRMGKRRVIAETGAGQHGVATATVAARLGLGCVVYMGVEDMERQQLNVFRMHLLGAEVVGVEAGGRGTTLGEHAARMAAAAGYSGARPGVLQGTYSYVLQTPDGQIATTHSVSAGLDYPAIGPEHAWLADRHRATYTAVSDDAAVAAARMLARLEGIIPALESAHALAELIVRAPKMSRDAIVILNLSGRGDKDMEILARYL